MRRTYPAANKNYGSPGAATYREVPSSAHVYAILDISNYRIFWESYPSHSENIVIAEAYIGLPVFAETFRCGDYPWGTGKKKKVRYSYVPRAA